MFGAIPLATQPKVGQGFCVYVPSLTADLEHSFEYGAVLRPPASRASLREDHNVGWIGRGGHQAFKVKHSKCASFAGAHLEKIQIVDRCYQTTFAGRERLSFADLYCGSRSDFRC
jgi:hypothetical protein